MNGNIIRITKEISFSDLQSGKVDPFEVYLSIVKRWILEPAEKIADSYPDNTDFGMALLALELMFFEPQGQFLTGKSSNHASKKTFCIAFDHFRVFLSEKKLISQEASSLTSDSIYKWARCGLFHSGRLANDLLVDAIDYSTFCLEKNRIVNGWLVDPWKLLPAINSYAEDYISMLKKGNDKELLNNFNLTFERLVHHPLQ